MTVDRHAERDAETPTPRFGRLAHEATVAAAAVRQGVQLCRAVRAETDPATLVKTDASPVTVADFGVQALVCRALLRHFAADPVMGEEDAARLRSPDAVALLRTVTERVCAVAPEATPDTVCTWIDRGTLDRTRPRFWVLDPIDGTKGFLRGGHYAVALALVENGRVVLGVLGCPAVPPPHGAPEAAGALLTAARGCGAWALPIEHVGSADATRLRVSAQADLARFRRCESFEADHGRGDVAASAARRLGILAPPMRIDSQAKYAAVARGEVELYLRLGTRAPDEEWIWDHAAGCLLVMEAGGTVTDVLGRELAFGRGRALSANRGVVASNGTRHDEIVAAVAAGLDVDGSDRRD